jgi:hypothetical protein
LRGGSFNNNSNNWLASNRNNNDPTNENNNAGFRVASPPNRIEPWPEATSRIGQIPLGVCQSSSDRAGLRDYPTVPPFKAGTQRRRLAPRRVASPKVAAKPF